MKYNGSLHIGIITVLLWYNILNESYLVNQ